MMIVMRNKSDLKSVSRFHNHLFDMEEENYELLELYEDIDEEVSELEDKVYQLEDDLEYEKEEMEKMRKEIKHLLSRVRRWKRLDEEKKDIVIEELERIMF